jgi:signal transduction histidine kinase
MDQSSPTISKLPALAALLVLLVGLLTLTGWALNIPSLKSVIPGLITMKANTALGLILLAAGLWLVRDPAGRWRATGVWGVCLGVFAIGVLTLTEYGTGRNFGIDEWLFVDPDGIGGKFPPGRLAPVTAVNFVLLAASQILLLARSPRALRTAHLLTMFAFLTALQGLVGYLLGFRYQFGLAFYTQMALHTSIGFLLLTLGILFTRPGAGLMAVLLSGTSAGHMARRLIAAAILVPILMSAIQSVGERHHWLGQDSGILFRVLGNIVLWSSAVWQATNALYRTQRQSDQYQAELQQALRSRDEFLIIVSHELRTPLASLKLGNQVQIRKLDRGDQRDFHSPEALRKSLAWYGTHIERLTRIVEDILDVGRLNAENLTFAREGFDFAALVEELAARWSPRFQAVGASLHCSVAGPLRGHWDRARIDQVIANLLANALKYGLGRPVQIQARQHEDSVTLTLTDQGMGIAPEDQQRIFEPYERAVPAISVSGFGLGLYLAKRIVHAHGGTIGLQSELGKGACFTVRLPLASPPTPDGLQIASAHG